MSQDRELGLEVEGNVKCDRDIRDCTSTDRRPSFKGVPLQREERRLLGDSPLEPRTGLDWNPDLFMCVCCVAPCHVRLATSCDFVASFRWAVLRLLISELTWDGERRRIRSASPAPSRL
jgi:hypothetical protein